MKDYLSRSFWNGNLRECKRSKKTHPAAWWSRRLRSSHNMKFTKWDWDLSSRRPLGFSHSERRHCTRTYLGNCIAGIQKRRRKSAAAEFAKLSRKLSLESKLYQQGLRRCGVPKLEPLRTTPPGGMCNGHGKPIAAFFWTSRRRITRRSFEVRLSANVKILPLSSLNVPLGAYFHEAVNVLHYERRHCGAQAKTGSHRGEQDACVSKWQHFASFTQWH